MFLTFLVSNGGNSIDTFVMSGMVFRSAIAHANGTPVTSCKCQRYQILLLYGMNIETK